MKPSLPNDSLGKTIASSESNLSGISNIKNGGAELDLQTLTRDEWESLCDGCAKCCLFKVEDEEDGKLYSTNVVCRYLDTQKCQCTCYQDRSVKVPECVTMSPQNLDSVYFMPSTCAYRLLAENKPLPDWHPLISGNPQSVHQSGHSVRGKVISEDEADDLMLHLTGEWE